MCLNSIDPHVREWSLITGKRGGGTKWEGGGKSSFTPTKSGRGKTSFSHAEGGGGEAPQVLR